MNSPFEKLSREELDELHITPVWISILIAGEDNAFTKKEIKNSVMLVNQKKDTSTGFLKDFYTNAATKFEVNMRGYITLLPENFQQRTEFLVKRLTNVNVLLEKIDMEHAGQLYSSFREFASGVARYSGGLFGLLSVSFAESKFIDLKMIRDPSGSAN
jgi:hypothetical protein